MNTQAGKDLPLVSFVIPCFNSVKYLARSLDSIIKEREESYPNLEIIVVDGGSKDGTVDVIRKYERHLAAWISEPDQGPADAFNKGWRVARGEFIRYMAADDEIIPGKTGLLVSKMMHEPSAAVVGGVVNQESPGPQGSLVLTRPILARGRVRRINFALWGTTPAITPEACLFRRNALNRLGGWDAQAKYRYCCDLEFWFRVVDGGYSIIVLDEAVVRKSIHPGAVTAQHGALVGQQTERLLRERAGILFALIYRARYSGRARRIVEAPFKILRLHPLRTLRRIRRIVGPENP